MSNRNDCELSIVMPCLNESETLGICIKKAQQFLREHHISGEIIVADNGSTDNSREIAARLGAHVISVETHGYGAALLSGIAAASGTYIIMGDADDSYDFSNLARSSKSYGRATTSLLETALRAGSDPERCRR